MHFSQDPKFAPQLGRRWISGQSIAGPISEKPIHTPPMGHPAGPAHGFCTDLIIIDI